MGGFFSNDVAQWVIAIAAVVAAITSVIALCVSIRNSRKISQVHVSINSRMDQLLHVNGIAMRAEGAQEERERRTAKPMD